MDLHIHELKSLFNSYKEGHTSKDELKKYVDNNNLFGRIIRKKHTEKDFEILSEPFKKLSFVMDGEGLCSLLGKDGNQMLIHTGHEQDWINHQVKAGTTFKLALFSIGPDKCFHVTWDNIIPLLKATYPELKELITSGMLDKYIADCKTLQYAEINKQWKHNILEVYYKGIADERFVTIERFINIAAPSLSDFRAFLFHEVGLSVLFNGNGYTMTEKGECGLREYITRNVRLSELPHALIDLTVVEL